MKTPPVAFVATLLLLAARPASAETLITALSTTEVSISSNFSGADLTVFGAIGRDAATVSRTADYDLVVVMRGPPEAIVVWRKERFLGIWMNRASETFAPVPSFYALHASRELDEIAGEPLLRRLGLGVDNLVRLPEDNPLSDSDVFADAFIRLKRESLRYAERPGAVALLGGNIFRTSLPLPANVPVGIYSVEVYLFSDSVLLARAEERLRISKSGLEQTLSAFARDQALIFGVGCVAMALAIGWLAGVIFRRD